MKSRKKIITLWPFVFLGLLLILLFWQVFFKGYVFIDGDNFHLNMPLKYLLVDSIKHGQFPLWNPYILGGIPYAADLNLGTFNIFNVLYFVFPISQALTLQVVSELFLIGSFAYILLRTFRFNKIGSLIGSVIFMLSGTIFPFSSNDAILHPIVYIPLLFSFAKKFLEQKKIRYFVFLVLVQVLQILSGHPQVTYYTMFFICLFLLFQKDTFFKRKVAHIVGYLFFSIIISSFQLVPFFEFVFLSNRPNHSLAYASSGSVDISHLLTIFFPTLFGTREMGNWWGPQTMLFGYIGVASFVLLLVGLRYGKFPQRAYFLFALSLSFILSLGKFGLFFYLFYFLVPGWSLFRSPDNLFVLGTFFTMPFVISGIGILVTKKEIAVTLGRKLLVPSILLSLLFGTISIASSFISWTALFLHFHSLPYVTKILFYNSEKTQSILAGVFTNIFLFSLLLLALSLIVRFAKKKILFICLLLFISLNLLLIDKTFLQLAPQQFYLQQSLPSLDSKDYRVFSEPVQLNQDRKNLPGPQYFYNEAKLNLLGVTDNHVMQYGLLTINGYSSLVLKNYADFLNTNNITGITSAKVTSEKLDQLAVEYIFSVKNNKREIIMRSSALSRGRLLSKSGTARIQESSTDSIKIDVHTTKEDTLVLADNYYPGWDAYVNNKKVTVSKYNGLFRSIAVPKGRSVVIFSYNPLSWKIGVGMSLIGMIILLGFIYKNKHYV